MAFPRLQAYGSTAPQAALISLVSRALMPALKPLLSSWQPSFQNTARSLFHLTYPFRALWIFNSLSGFSQGMGSTAFPSPSLSCGLLHSRCFGLHFTL